MPQSFTSHARDTPFASRRTFQILILITLWALVYLLSVGSPPLLDDADATHAQAAQAMLQTGDWVTLHVNGIRYLEKPPLPYWLTAASMAAFGQNAFAVHLPLALTVLGLAALGWVWGRRAFGDRAGFYAALFTLTAVGPFLFTRVFIPDALLSLLLAFTLYATLRATDDPAASRRWALLGWLALAAAVLTKGLVAIVFLVATVGLFLWITGQAGRWRTLHPVPGLGLFLLVAAPWHILAGLRNTGGLNGHGFFWFYFINEHVLRFLNRRIPRDYNKVPNTFYWPLHLVWLFPWSLFAPVAVAFFWRRRARLFHLRQPDLSFRLRSALILGLFSALVMVFFSVSTNQEYYTFPVYLPLLLLTAGALAAAESSHTVPPVSPRLSLACHAVLAAIASLAAVAIGLGLWSSRALPPAPDVGALLAHRAVGQYTLSLSHFFDLTGPSFSALRLPALLACVALGFGPLLGLWLRARGRHFASTLTIAATCALFLVAAHLALERFGSLLSSADFATRIQQLRSTHAVEPDAEVLIFGDQAFGSSIPFYLRQRVLLVDGRSTSMYFGSTFPDAPAVFLTSRQLLASWGTGPRKLLFVPLERRDDVNALLGTRQVLLFEHSGKALVSDRPLK